MDLQLSSNCSSCELNKKNFKKIEERYFQYKKLLIHTNKLLEKYDILMRHSKTVEDKLKKEQISAAQVKKILVPLLTQLLPLQNDKKKFESQLKQFEDEIEVLKGVVIAEQQQTKQYSALSSRLEADLKSANAVIENTKEELNAAKKDIKHNAVTHKLAEEKLHEVLKSVFELSFILKQNKLLPVKYVNRLRVWKKQFNKIDETFQENQFSPSITSIETGFDSSKYSSSDEEEDLISLTSMPDYLDDYKSCLKNDIGINTNLSMYNHRFESISQMGDNCIEVADIGTSTDLYHANLSQIDRSYSFTSPVPETVEKTTNDMTSNLGDEFYESSSDLDINILEKLHDANSVTDSSNEDLKNADLQKIFDTMKMDIPVVLSPLMPDGPCDKCFFPKRDVSTMTRVEFCDASTSHETILINAGVQCSLSETINSFAEVAVQCNITSSKNNEILNAEMENLYHQKHDNQILKSIDSILHDKFLNHAFIIKFLNLMKELIPGLQHSNFENVVGESFRDVKTIWENSDIKTEQEKSPSSSQVSCSKLDNVSERLFKSDQYSFSNSGICCSWNDKPSRNLLKNFSNLERYKRDSIKPKDKHKRQFSQGSVRCKKKPKRLNYRFCFSSRIRHKNTLNKCKLVNSSSGNFIQTTNIGSNVLFERSALKQKIGSKTFNKRDKIPNLKQSFRKMSQCTSSLDDNEFTTRVRVLKPSKSALEKAKISIDSSTLCSVANSGTCFNRKGTVNTNADVIPNTDKEEMRNVNWSIFSDKSELSSETGSDSGSEYEAGNIPEINKFQLSATNLNSNPKVSKETSQLQHGTVKIINKDSSLLCNKSPLTKCVLNEEQTYAVNSPSNILEFESGFTPSYTSKVLNASQKTKDTIKCIDLLNVGKFSSIKLLEQPQNSKSIENSPTLSPIMACPDYCVKDTDFINTTISESEDTCESDCSNETLETYQSKIMGRDANSALVDNEGDRKCEAESIPEMNIKCLSSSKNLSNDPIVSEQISQLQSGKVNVINCSQLSEPKCVSNEKQTSALTSSSNDLEFEFENVSNMNQRTKNMLKSADNINIEKCSSIALLEQPQHFNSNEYTAISPIKSWPDCVKDTCIIDTIRSKSEESYKSECSDNFASYQSMKMGSDTNSALADTDSKTYSVEEYCDASNKVLKTLHNIETKKFTNNSNVSSKSNCNLDLNLVEKSEIVHSSERKGSYRDKMKHNSHIMENAVSRKISTKELVSHNFLTPTPVTSTHPTRNQSPKVKALENKFKENLQKKYTPIKCQAIGSNVKQHTANIHLDKINKEMLFGSDSDSSVEDAVKIEHPRGVSKLCQNLASDDLNVVNLVSSKIKPVLRKASSYPHIQLLGLPKISIKRTNSLPILFKSPTSWKGILEYKNSSRHGQMSSDGCEQFQRKGVKRTNIFLSSKQSDKCTTKTNINENVKEVESSVLPILFPPNKKRIAHIPGVSTLKTSSAIIDEKHLHCKPSTSSSVNNSENLFTHTSCQILQENNFDYTKCQNEEYGGVKTLSRTKTLSKLSCQRYLDHKNVKCLSKLGILRQKFIKQKTKYKIMAMDEKHKEGCQADNSQVHPLVTNKRLCVRKKSKVEFDANSKSSVNNHIPISPKHSIKENNSNVVINDHGNIRILRNCSTELSSKCEFNNSTLQLEVSNSSKILNSKNVSDPAEKITPNNLKGKKFDKECSDPLSQSNKLVPSHEPTHCTPLNSGGPIKECLKANLQDEMKSNQVSPVNQMVKNIKIKSFTRREQLEIKIESLNKIKNDSHIIKGEYVSINTDISPEGKTDVNVCETVISQSQCTSIPNKFYIHEKGGVLESALQLRNCAKESKFHRNYEGTLKPQMDNFLCQNLSSTTLYEAANLLNKTSDVENLSRYIFEVVRDDSSEIDNSFTPPALPLTSTQQKLLTLMMVMQKEYVGFASLVDVFLSAVECFVLKLSNNAPSVSLLCKIARFYCAVCRIKTCTSRVHAFCYDALYCLKRKCFPLIYTVLTCYPEALPIAAIGMESPRCVAMVHVIMSYDINNINATFKLSDLKHLLRKNYGYKNLEDLMLDNIMKNVLKKLRYSSPKSKEIQAALILLAKIQGLNWTVTSLIRNGLVPIIRDWYNGKLPEAPALQSVEIFGAVLKPFSCDIDLTKEVTVLGSILSYPRASFNLKLATVMSLSKLISHNYTLVANFLYNWIPEEPVPKTFLTNLSYLLLTRPYSSWATYLKSKKVVK